MTDGEQQKIGFDRDGSSPLGPANCCAAVAAENRELRIMLAIAHAGLELYTDDGELQDNRCHPWIDFKRDSVAQIEQKLHERAFKRERRHNNRTERPEATK